MEWQLILSTFILAWIILNLLDRLEVLSRFNLSVESGFFLAWRTDKGKELIEKLVNKYKNFFSKLGVLNIFTSIAALLVASVFLIFQLIVTVEQTSVVSQLQIENALIIPGINEYIPIIYGSIALGVAIIFHEFSHGIYARLEQIKISSLGIGIFAVIPLAFVEPDEDDIEKSGRLSKIKMFAAGVSTNVYIAIITFVVVASLIALTFTPASLGLGVTAVNKTSPAYETGIRENMIITQINNQKINNRSEFLSIMNQSSPGENLSIQTNSNGTFYVTLSERKGESFLGVVAPPIKGVYDNFKSPLFYILPPAAGSLSLLDSPFFESAIDPTITLPLIRAGFWIILFNFWLGIINMMPIYPIDGGRVFKELINDLVDRIDVIKNKKKASKHILTIISVVFLLIYVLPIVVLIIL